MNSETAAALDRVERQLRSALAEVQRLRGSATPGSEDDEWLRLTRLLAAISQRGGTLPKAEIRRLAVGFGYDPRGVGGFYRGNGSLRSVPDDNAELTEVGRQLLAENRWRLKSRGEE